MSRCEWSKHNSFSPGKSIRWYVCMLSGFSVSDSLWPHGLLSARLLCPWDSPGKNTGVDSHSLLQGLEPRSPALQVYSLLYEPPTSNKSSDKPLKCKMFYEANDQQSSKVFRPYMAGRRGGKWWQWHWSKATDWRKLEAVATACCVGSWTGAWTRKRTRVDKPVKTK